MVWFSPEQDEIIFLRSQQKSSHDDNHSVLREMEVRPGWGGGTWEPLFVCQAVCVVVLRRNTIFALRDSTGLARVFMCPEPLSLAATSTDIAAEFCPYSLFVCFKDSLIQDA